PVAGRAGLGGGSEGHAVSGRDPAGIAAGGEAVDPRRIAAVVLGAGVRESIEGADIDALIGQHPALELGAEEVAADTPVAPHDPVARNEEWDRIVRQRRAHRPCRRGAADLPCDPAVGPDLPARAAGSLPTRRIGRPKRAWKVASNSSAEPPGLTADTPWALYATKTGPIGASSRP